MDGSVQVSLLSHHRNGDDICSSSSQLTTSFSTDQSSLGSGDRALPLWQDRPTNGRRGSLGTTEAQIRDEFRKSLLPSVSSRRLSSVDIGQDASFTINKLLFGNIGLIGRQQEEQELRDALLACQRSRGKPRCLVLVHGKSGSGKSSLVESGLARHTNSLQNGLYVYGKFDQTKVQPYAAIAVACGELCGSILRRRSAEEEGRFLHLRQSIEKELSGETTILTQIVPVLQEILMNGDVTGAAHYSTDSDGEERSVEEKMEQSPEETKARFHFAFRKFLRIVGSTYYKTIVMTLDDVQWADEASIQLL